MQLRHLIIGVCLVGASSATALDLTPMAALSLAKTGKSFARTVALSLPPGVPVGEGQVVYGHQDVGFFSVDQYEQRGPEIEFSVLPLSLKLPQSFYYVWTTAAGRQHVKHLKTVRFRAPQHILLEGDRQLQLTGKALPQPLTFFVGAIPQQVAGMVELEEIRNASMIYAVNAVGEIVWLHVPDLGKRVLPAISGLGVDRFGQVHLLADGKNGFYEVVTGQGEVVNQADLQLTLPALPTTAGLYIDTLGDVYTGGWQQGWRRDLLRPWSQPVAYASNPIMRWPAGHMAKREDVFEPMQEWAVRSPSVDDHNLIPQIWTGWSKPMSQVFHGRLRGLSGQGATLLAHYQDPDRLVAIDKLSGAIQWQAGTADANCKVDADLLARSWSVALSPLGRIAVVHADQGQAKVTVMRCQHKRGPAEIVWSRGLAKDFFAVDAQVQWNHPSSLSVYLRATSADRPATSRNASSDLFLVIDTRSKKIQTEVQLPVEFYSPGGRFAHALQFAGASFHSMQQPKVSAQ